MRYQSLVRMFLGFMVTTSLTAHSFKEGKHVRRLQHVSVGPEEYLRVGDDPSVQQPFSTEWAGQYFNASTTTLDNTTGSYPGRGSYVWRICGFGSNMNNLLNTWVYALAVKKWSNFSLIMTNAQLVEATCEEESGGQASKGWGCLFGDIPHVCIFNSMSSWGDAMKASGAVSEEEIREAMETRFPDVISDGGAIYNELDGTGVDYVGALTTILSHLWRFMTPWLRDMVDQVVYNGLTEKIGEEPFIGIHVRRGDIISVHQASFIASEEYLKAAEEYFQEANDSSAVEGIKGVWVASNDPTVVHDVRAIVRNYFPNVKEENVVWGQDVVLGREEEATWIPTYTMAQSLSSFAHLFADLEQLAAAQLFVGTFTSNVGRLVYLFREAAGKTRESTLSLETANWHPGRHGR